MNFNSFILFLPLLSFCLCEITDEKKSKLLSDFINYYNLRPNVKHRASDGFIQSISEIDDTTYLIEISFRAKHGDVSKMMKCSAVIEDLDDRGIAIVNNVVDCEDLEQQAVRDADAGLEVVEVQAEREPLDEEQDNASITPGEHYISLPGNQPSAPGVRELVLLGVRHLDLHDPSVKHSLNSVIEVQRQLQVNGVRYILLLSINYNNCTDKLNDLCTSTKTCRIAILVKPLQTLPGSATYKEIQFNNCTEQRQFSDNGEIAPESTDSNDHNKNKENVESLYNNKETIKVEEIKALEEQKPPYEYLPEVSNWKSDTLLPKLKETNKDYVIKIESNQRFKVNSLPETQSTKSQIGSSSRDKKEAIDEMLYFLNVSGYKPKVHSEDSMKRSKRSYDYDLQVLSLTQDYRDLKKSIENAKYVYAMAQAMVDYLNVIDMEVKNRAIKNVIKAEEENDNGKDFVYIQAQVVIPCDTPNCEPKETQTKICNGVIDSTNKESPQVLYSFCHTDTKEMEVLDKLKDVDSDDPVLLRLSKEVIKKIEIESSETHAMKIKKIVSAKTRLTSGRLTKMSMIVNYINCSKSVPLVLRKKCSTLEYLGSQICEVLVHERQWLKERTITYTCTERPIDMIINKDKQHRNIAIEDPKIAEIMQDTLQYLEIQYGKKNKLKLINISNISTQIVAGFLIKIEFIVGYTNCTDIDLESQSSKCELLRNENLRRCKAQIWDRLWIVDGRQIEVLCDEDQKIQENLHKIRRKRDTTFEKVKYRETDEPVHISKLNLKDTSKSTVLGEIEQNPNEPVYLKLAQESLQKYAMGNEIQHPYLILQIEKVTTQVVSGFLTRINFLAAPKNNLDDHVLQCFSKIWEQSWLNKKEIDVSCVNIYQRSKGESVLGGEEEQNPDNPVYLKLAQDSLQKYTTDNGIQKPYSVLRIEKVTTQVVSGFLTRINFLAAPKNNLDGHVLQCFSKIWEQSWLNKKEINISCVDIYPRFERHSVLGGQEEQNPDEPVYLKLAQDSLQKYTSDNGIEKPYSVLRIEKVTTQVVSGFLTRINFLAAPKNNLDGHVLQCFSKMWEQSWLNKKEINISCVDIYHRFKREAVLGGQEEQNPEEPVYLKLAQDSLQKYTSDNGIEKPYSVLRIEKVTTQVVSGFLTRINFLAAPKNNLDGHVLQCFSKIWEQSWLNKKEINISCVDIYPRFERHSVLGGQEEQNPDEPVYLKLAQDSLQKYTSDNGIEKPYSVLRIEKVTTQVVSGFLTRINFLAAPKNNLDGHVLQCFSKMWEQSWLNKKEINISCVDIYHRFKREAVLGGQEEQNPEEPVYLKLAQDSLQKYTSDNGIEKPYSVLRIEKVTTQVVSGFLTRINFLAAPKNNLDGHVLQCFSKIWEQSWLNKKEINISCVDIYPRFERHSVLGGQEEQNPDEPVYLKLAQDSLQKYTSDNGIEKPYSVLRIEKVTTQVVSGFLTRINFLAAPKNNLDGHVLQCFSKIWEQSWLNKKEIDVSCVNIYQRSKGESVLGGEEEQNPDNPVYLKLAQDSLQKYTTDNGIEKPYSVLRIEKVTTQVVSGFLTRINFLAAPKNNLDGHVLQCFSKMWEQSWLNKKEINISCVDIYPRFERHSVLGGQEEQNPNEPVNLKLAQDSLQKYTSDNGIEKPYSVLRIEKVTTQVVSGFLTRINFLAAPKNNLDGHVLQCFSKIWEQSWLNKKEIDVSCVNIYQRSKGESVLGGEEEQNPDNPVYLKLAQDSLQKYTTDNGIEKPYSVLRIEKVTTQVVSGFLTRINFLAAPKNNLDGHVLQCFSKMWEQSWLNKKEINISCVDIYHRFKREAVLGGQEEQNPEEPVYLKLAQDSLQKYTADNGIQKPYSVLRIEKVTTQVVSGFLTRINFLAAPKNNLDGHVLQCFSKIWEQSWLNEKEINISCVDIYPRFERHSVLGGQEEQNPDEPVYLKLAQDSLQKYTSDNGIEKPYSVLRIEKVTTQVVSGFLTRINFLAAPKNNLDGHVLQCFSKIWEQSWLNKKEIDVSYVDIYPRFERHSVLGGQEEQNPDEPVYLKLAQDSLQKYTSDNGIQKPYSVLRIEKVTTQVVSGFLTRINFLAAPKNNLDGHVLQCFSKIWEQSWLNKKEINISCVDIYHRFKREAVLGGQEEQNPEEPVYLKLAQDSLQKYTSDNGIEKPYSVLRIEKVTTQVVSGFLTRINFLAAPKNNLDGHVLQCFSKMWEQSWLNKKEINISCVDIYHRFKREAVLGGQEEQNPEEPVYLKLAQDSLQKYTADNGIQKPYSVLRIEKVTTQVVSGFLTRINFLAAPKNNLDGHVLQCFSKIWEQSWLNKKEINISCVDIYPRFERHSVLGGQEEQNPDEPVYLKLAQDSLQKYTSDNGIEKPYSVLRIEKVTTQVVSGFLTRINFLAAPKNNLDGHVLQCFSKIWEQSWLNKKEIDVSCVDIYPRFERHSVLGGQEEQNPDEPVYLKLAQDSLQKYTSDNGIQKPYSVLRIEKVTTQVVSGFLTRINFLAAPKNNLDGHVLQCFSKMWEQSWLNKKEINISCVDIYHRFKREAVLGGQEEQNPEEPVYLKLAQDSLQKYTSDNGIEKPYSVLRIEKVTTQVVSGFLTRINFLAAPKNNLDGHVLQCFSKMWEQSWLNKKEINISCVDIYHRFKREAVLGGQEEQNPEEPVYLKLAQDSLQKYTADNGIQKPYSVLRIEKVTTQVVSGFLTRINFLAAPKNNLDGHVLQCFSKIWEQSWLNKKEINISCVDIYPRFERHSVLGGQEEQNPDEPVYLKLAQDSLQKYTSDNGIEKPYSVLRIEKVTTQVVSGFLTRINFLAAPKNNLDGHVLQCFSKIWEQSWLNKKEIDVSCVNIYQRSKGESVLGGEVEQNPDNPVYLKLAQDSLQKYTTDNGIQKPYSVLRIEKVTTQVVSGFLTRINFLAAPKNNLDGHVLQCFSKIWEQSWLNKKEIDVSCVNIYQRSKGESVLGGEEEQNPDNPVYLKLAQDSLQKYTTDNGIEKPYSVLRIEKVTTQVVSGFLTRINFLAAPKNNLDGHVLQCFSKMWEQSWLNKKEINISCVDIYPRFERHSVLGGQEEQNPDEPVYLKLAQDSLQKYTADNGIQKPYSVLRIEKVTTQVVSGFLTRINFLAAPKNNLDGHVLQCFSKIWEQSWLNKKEIDVSCVNIYQRSKGESVLGGEEEQNPDNPVYLKLAQDSLQKYTTDNGIEKPYSVLRIEKVTTQVVSGFLTRINFLAAPKNNLDGHVLQCFSKMWEQSWLNKKEINISCVDIYPRFERHSVLGGQEEQNPDEPVYLKLAQDSLQKYTADNGIQKPYSVLRIEKVTTQVVLGFLTRINFLAAPRNNLDGHVLQCFSKIWEQAWLNERQIDVSCEMVRHRLKRQIVGGEVVQNPNEPIYLQLAQESLQKFVTESEIQQPYSVFLIEKVTTQVLSGFLTRIYFKASPYNNPDGDIYKCFSKIVEELWLHKKEIDVFCEIDKHRFRREITGSGLTEQDSSDPQYLQLAEKSLAHYLLETYNKEPHKVIKVEKVTTQVFSGVLTRLNFIVLPVNVSNSDILKCYSEVWVLLTEKTDIKVSCQFLYKVVDFPQNSTYLQWANESLQKYLSDTQHNQSYNVVQIEEASTRGYVSNIIFVANSTEKLDGPLNCVSVISHKPKLSEKKIDVICETDNLVLRKKWSIKDDPMYNKYQYTKHHKVETDLAVTKPEFQLLASQSLRQFSNKVGILYKLFYVKMVTKSISSDVVYKIHFTAFPTDCLSNVSNTRALTCNMITNSTVNCKANIYGELRLSSRKIEVECVMPEDYLDLLDSMEENLDDFSSKAEISRKTKDSKAHNFAEEALQKYLSFIDTKNFYRVTGIHSYYEHLAEEVIEFSISPTTCLSLKFTGTGSTDSCPFKQPRLIYYCNAKRNSLEDSKADIKVSCERMEMVRTRFKRQINNELADDTDNEVDEDTMYYYAKAAVSKINENPQNNNIFKLITIHAVKSTVQMKAVVVKMYLEVAETYCVRFQSGVTIENCEEMEGLNHKLCLARIFPAPGDDLVIRHVNVVCDDDEISFNVLTGLHVFELLRLSLQELERKPEFHFKLVHQGEPQLIPTLEAKKPLKLNFVIATTNCSKTVDLDKNPYQCYIDTTIPSRSCSSFIWLETATRIIKYINVNCNSEMPRQKRSSLNGASLATDTAEIKDLVAAALQKLEMASLHRYKQRVLHINSYSSKITTGKVTTIDFDVAYTSCLKYEWVQNITSCDIIDHLPRRHCVAQIWERLWIHNGRHINVTCEDDETPLEAHIEFESAEMAMQLAQEALKHIEAKYPHPQKQKVVRIFSLEKQTVAGIHYKMKVEVGFTNCLALSTQINCTLDNDTHINRFCRVNVWVRPWTDHPPNFRVSCDFQESATSDLYHDVQAEHLFYNFVATYNPSYSNDHVEFENRFEIFRANIKKIHELNVHEKGTATYGVTRFSDLTYKEFKTRYMGLNTNLRNYSQISMKEADIPNVNLPENFDWREFDSVTEVKDQGSCGSSWAFSVIGNIEAQWRMQSGELLQLSEQQLLDCDNVNHGCEGGLPERAYRVIEELGGVETEANYPYEAEVSKCLFNKTMSKVKIQGSVNITSNETAMAQWLVQNGPISIGINAMAMQFYVGGISHPWKSYCNSSDIDHAALIVGFGVKDYPAFHKKIPYWIVKNSWGKSWGEQGYYRVYRGDGTCGVDRMATSAFIPSM